LLRLAEQELGPPPCPYAWIVFGSEGRQEQILLTDQDNALIYRDDTPQACQYFSQLAQQVVNGLIQAGFPPCSGGYMATNWLRPLKEWKQLFKSWVETPEPQALLEASIFFDLRAVYGALNIDSLDKILLNAGKNALFLAHMARNALGFQPPLGFFRRIVEEEGGVDLKKGGLMPIVNLARLYALAAGAPARSTLARLEAIKHNSDLGKDKAEILIEAFHFFLHLRLREQLRTYQAGRLPGNRVPLDALLPLERINLKEVFLAIREIQNLTGQAFQIGRLG
jgi:CBS domain-containing protein